MGLFGAEHRHNADANKINNHFNLLHIFCEKGCPATRLRSLVIRRTNFAMHPKEGGENPNKVS